MDSKTRALAERIYIKQLQSGYLNMQNRKNYEAIAKQAVELARLFEDVLDLNKGAKLTDIKIIPEDEL